MESQIALLEPMETTKAVTIVAIATVPDRFQPFTMSPKSNSKPIKFMKKMSPTFATTVNVDRDDSGKMVLEKPGMRPNAVGPSKIPATISASTEGS